MANYDVIRVVLHGREIGRIGLDLDRAMTSFQYHPEIWNDPKAQQIFPDTGIIRPKEGIQLFDQFFGGSFKGLPPQIADSLPDRFGNIIFKTWMNQSDKEEISILEQLAYIADRGIGALEYLPSKELPRTDTIELDEIIDILQQVMDMKQGQTAGQLETQALINIFKIGSSAGGARPKIIISEHKKSGNIIPGDLETSDSYHHYLVKLALNEESSYPREIVEYCYYLTARSVGIEMMDSKLIDDRHFATLRFDRQAGQKVHILTASGMTGWDFQRARHSSYENLFKLCSYLQISHRQMTELFKRMVFNVVFRNTDDHLKNHAFIYDPERDRWSLSPAYDLTMALNPLYNFKKVNRALSINGKRDGITRDDLLTIAEAYTIKNPKAIIEQVMEARSVLQSAMSNQGLENGLMDAILKKLRRI